MWLITTPICIYYYHSPESIWPSIVIMLSVILSAAINPEVIILQKEIKLKKYFFLFVLPKIISFHSCCDLCAVFSKFFGR